MEKSWSCYAPKVIELGVLLLTESYAQVPSYSKYICCHQLCQFSKCLSTSQLDRFELTVISYLQQKQLQAKT